MAPAGTLRQITKHQVNIARYKGPKEVHIARKAVQLGEHHCGANGFGVREGLCKLAREGDGGRRRWRKEIGGRR